MDKALLGRRLAEARTVAKQTQQSLAAAVGLDRTAIVQLEKGERHLKVTELIEIAGALGRPLSYFVDASVPAAVSRRSAPEKVHESTLELDVEIDQFAGNVRSVARLGRLSAADLPSGHVPTSHAQAEGAAATYRKHAGLGTGSISDLAATCESLGLFSYAAPLGMTGPDGGCIEVFVDTARFGVAVINGDAPSGRRRMTLAHELGHWLLGDAYDSQASFDNEKMINSFAIHFLAPRSGVHAVWNKWSGEPVRDRALHVGVEFKLSWSATVAQLRNLDIIDQHTHDGLRQTEPTSGDYLRLGLKWGDELRAPSFSPGYVMACLDAYADSDITAERTLELLRGMIGPDDLPAKRPRTAADFKAAFTGHSDLDVDG